MKVLFCPLLPLRFRAHLETMSLYSVFQFSAPPSTPVAMTFLFT